MTQPDQPSPSAGSPNPAPRPLDGVRVLDLATFIAAPYSAALLGEIGAEVIKIEHPAGGDPMRRFGTPTSAEGRTLAWLSEARNKESVTLDLKSQQDAATFCELVRRSDVVCENFRPGTLEKWGLGPDRLFELNPKLVILRISGYGQTGPYKNKPGFGSLIEGMSGFASMTGWEDKPPLLPPLALADMVAGLAGFGGVLSAIIARDKGQVKGQVVDLSLFEPLFGILGPCAASYEATGKVPQRTGNASDGAAPRGLYQTKDGKFIAMSASMQSMWEKLAAAIGRPELNNDPRYSTSLARIKHAHELDEIIAEDMKTRTLDENLAYFDSQGVTVGPICDISDLIDHPYVRGREVLQDFEYEGMDRLPMHQSFPRLSETPGTVRTPAPKLGEHTAEILAELGFSDVDITQESI